MEMFGFDGCVISFEKVVSFCKYHKVFWSFQLLLGLCFSCFAKVNSEWKNVPKQLRKTVIVDTPNRFKHYRNAADEFICLQPKWKESDRKRVVWGRSVGLGRGRVTT